MILPWKNSWLGWRSTKSSTFFRSIVTDPIDRRSISRFNEPGGQAFNLLMLLLSSNFLLPFLLLLPLIPDPFKFGMQSLQLTSSQKFRRLTSSLLAAPQVWGLDTLSHCSLLAYSAIAQEFFRILRAYSRHKKIKS
jgi:hypothetical protein